MSTPATTPNKPINPAKRARQLFGDLFGAKNPKARAKAMQEFASLSPGEQSFIQAELSYMNVLGQERLLVAVQELREQLDDDATSLIETLDRLTLGQDDALAGHFDDLAEESIDEAEEYNGDDGDDGEPEDEPDDDDPTDDVDSDDDMNDNDDDDLDGAA